MSDIIDQLYENIQSGLSARCNVLRQYDRRYRSKFTVRLPAGQTNFIDPYTVWNNVVSAAYNNSGLIGLITTDPDLSRISMHNYVVWGSGLRVRYSTRDLKVRRSMFNKKVITGRIRRH